MRRCRRELWRETEIVCMWTGVVGIYVHINVDDYQAYKSR